MPDGSIVELPTLWIKFYRDGRPIRESAQTTSHREAEQKLKTRIKEIQDDTFCGPKAERLRIGDLLDDLLTDYQVNQKSYRDFADPAVRLHVRPYFGSMRARELDTPRVQAYQLQRRKEGAANGTINRECALLRRAFNLARKQTPPTVKLVPYIPRLREDNVRKGFLEHAQFVALRAALPEEIRPILTFAYYTGCRRGEILSLKWSQVDLLRPIVRLEPGETKNDDAREFVPVPELLTVLGMQKAARDQLYPTCPWVFCRNGRPIRDFRGAWESACATVGLVDQAGKPTRIFHDLRRTGVRNLIRAGVSERVAMRISGHRSRSVFDRYNVTSDRDLHDAARKLANYIEELNKLGTLTGTLAEAENTGGQKLQSKLLN